MIKTNGPASPQAICQLGVHTGIKINDNSLSIPIATIIAWKAQSRKTFGSLITIHFYGRRK